MDEADGLVAAYDDWQPAHAEWSGRVPRTKGKWFLRVRVI
jgi:hypothetical protein